MLSQWDLLKNFILLGTWCNRQVPILRQKFHTSIYLGKSLIAEVAKPAPDPLVKKRKLEEDGIGQDKKKKEDDNRSQEQRLAEATTPYYNIPYEEQVAL